MIVLCFKSGCGDIQRLPALQGLLRYLGTLGVAWESQGAPGQRPCREQASTHPAPTASSPGVCVGCRLISTIPELQGTFPGPQWNDMWNIQANGGIQRAIGLLCVLGGFSWLRKGKCPGLRWGRIKTLQYFASWHNGIKGRPARYLGHWAIIQRVPKYPMMDK